MAGDPPGRVPRSLCGGLTPGDGALVTRRPRQSVIAVASLALSAACCVALSRMATSFTWFAKNGGPARPRGKVKLRETT